MSFDLGEAPEAGRHTEHVSSFSRSRPPLGESIHDSPRRGQPITQAKRGIAESWENFAEDTRRRGRAVRWKSRIGSIGGAHSAKRAKQVVCRVRFLAMGTNGQRLFPALRVQPWRILTSQLNPRLNLANSLLMAAHMKMRTILALAHGSRPTTDKRPGNADPMHLPHKPATSGKTAGS